MKIPNFSLSLNALLPFILANALHVLAALAILIAGFWISGKASDLVRVGLNRTKHFDEMLKGFFGSIARYFVLTLTLLTVLSQFGVQTTSLVAVIGAASLAIGLALQGTLSNLAAGVMLLIFRPFRIGQHVQVGGNDGVVKELSLFWTEIVTDGNVQIIIPNGSVWGSAIKNMSVYDAPVATVELRMPVPKGFSVEAARARLLGIVGKVAGVKDTPAPKVYLDRSGADNALQLVAVYAPVAGAEAQARTDILMGAEAVEAV